MGVAFRDAASASASVVARDSSALLLVSGHWFRTLYRDSIEFAFVLCYKI